MESTSLEAFRSKQMHFIGIGGSSMSGLAKLFAEIGVKVTGSDMVSSHKTEALERAGIPVCIGHDPSLVRDADLVIYSAAVPPTDPERHQADLLAIPQMERADLLGLVAGAFPCPICVSGTHGKTTTTAMISQMLWEAGLDPTIHIGGELEALQGSTRLGHGDHCVVEACEYARTFLKLRPRIAIILNIDADHLDTYGDIDHIEEAFAQFAGQTVSGGWVIGCGDDERVRRVLAGCGRRIRTYGLQPHNEITAEQISYDETGCASFVATLFGHPLAEVDLRIPGKHSICNALAAIAAAEICQVPMRSVAETLSRFSNPKRRFELTGVTDGVRLYTDYSHAPAEIRNAIHNAAAQPHGTLWSVWQPHTFARTRLLYPQFLECFAEADRVLITDIMCAREEPDPSLNSGMLVSDLRRRGVRADWAPSFDDAEAFLRGNWQEGDIVITLGCGNIDLLNEQIRLQGDSASRPTDATGDNGL